MWGPLTNILIARLNSHSVLAAASKTSTDKLQRGLNAAVIPVSLIMGCRVWCVRICIGSTPLSESATNSACWSTYVYLERRLGRPICHQNALFWNENTSPLGAVGARPSLSLLSWHNGDIAHPEICMTQQSLLQKQVAQLSQRDRAAGWVSYGQKWKTGTGRQYLRTI